MILWFIEPRPHHKGRLVQQLQQLLSGLFADSCFRGAMRWVRFRGIDADDSYVAITKFECVAVNHTIAAPTKAAKCELA